MDFFDLVGGGAWYVVALVIAISIIISIHEFGHYIVGRWCGIEADVYSVGFGPVLAARTDRRGTRWQIAAIPLGGYVKFRGDADVASVRGTATTADERRHTMEGAPLWARVLTVLAGPLANFVLTFVVLMGLILASGIVTDVPTISRLAALPESQPLAPGDRILAIGDTPVPDTAALSSALSALPDTPQVSFTIERDGEEMTLLAPHPQPALVASVQPKSAAVDAGLRAGDLILDAGGRAIISFTDLQDVIFNSDGAPVPLTVWRDGEVFDLTLVPRPRDIPTANGAGFEHKWMIGVASALTFDLGTRAPTLWETVSLPAVEMWRMTATTFSGLYHMIVGKISTCGMSGFVGIAETMGDAAKVGANSYLSMLAILSLGIGILNLLPIPILDGGHLAFYLYEGVAGRPPSDRALRALMSVGLTILLGFLGYTLVLDLTCV